MDAPLLIETAGTTAVLTLNRPRQRNALDLALREALADAVPRIRDDPAVRAVVITGAGGHFCAGADVKLLAQAQAARRDVFEGRERIRRFRLWMDELIDLEKPVIAAVEGNAVGAGLVARARRRHRARRPERALLRRVRARRLRARHGRDVPAAARGRPRPGEGAGVLGAFGGCGGGAADRSRPRGSSGGDDSRRGAGAGNTFRRRRRPARWAWRSR